MLRRLRLSAPMRTFATHTTPPPVKPYKSGPLPPPAPKTTPTPNLNLTPEELKSNSWLNHPPKPEPLDPARGVAASLRAAREGVLDPRYKPASRRVLAIICAVPIFLVTSWVLFQRQFLGVEQKTREKKEENGVEVVGEGAEAEVVGGKV